MIGLAPGAIEEGTVQQQDQSNEQSQSDKHQRGNKDWLGQIAAGMTSVMVRLGFSIHDLIAVVPERSGHWFLFPRFWSALALVCHKIRLSPPGGKGINQP